MNEQPHVVNAPQDEASLRLQLIQLAKLFLAEGLVVRTWGNFSLRLDRDTFLVTPSGRSYEDLAPDELVKCSIATGKKIPEEEGKPSSEAPMHAIAYRNRPECNVLAHTHQVYASALSLSNSSVLLDPESREKLGISAIPIAPYGLPGTKTLHRNVEQTLEATDSPIILMERHGAFILGENQTDCHEKARSLEASAKQIYERLVGHNDNMRTAIHENTPEEENALVDLVRDIAGKLSDNHDAVQSEEIGYAVISCDPELQPLLNRPMGAYLDDFAQICGVTIKQKPGKNNVYFTPEKQWAICFGKTVSDAQNVRAVLEKNVRACHIAKLNGKRPLSWLESSVMRTIYLKKYSKQAEKKQ